MFSSPDNYSLQRALVVDDDSTIRLLARNILEQSGFSVEVAENGHQALAVIGSYMPDLVMLDVLMPGIDGFTVCQQIKTMPGSQSCTIIMMTGLDDFDSVQRAYDVGATDFVIKPINWQVLGYRSKYVARATQAFKDLHTSETRLKHAHAVARLGIWEWHVSSDSFNFSETIGQLFALQSTDQPHSLQTIYNLIHPLDKERVQSAIEATLQSHVPCGIDARVTLDVNCERFIRIEAEAFTENGTVLRLSGTMQDITDRKLSENKIRSLAYYDQLTGLANRVQFNETMELALSATVEAKGTLALFFMDLDRFKVINDTLGHEAGDLLLKQVAERLKSCLRWNDGLSIAPAHFDYNAVSRLGGDEFTIVLQKVSSDSGASKVAKRVIDVMEKPFLLDDNEVFISVSIGISIFPDDGTEAGSLIKNADAAMYHAKAQGGNNFQFYDQSMNASAMERLMMERDLRKALERNEFVLHYQPQIDTDSGAMIAMEALMRWQHPEKGLLFPDSFIPLAEESGLITAIDKWVLTAACLQIKTWSDSKVRPVRVAVNLSGRDFLQNKMLGIVQEVLESTGINPALLELELTEGVLMKNANETIETLKALKQMGLKLSIDDFGTGYSSLSYLKRFPLDMLKIDRSFVFDVHADSNNAGIVTAIIAMARQLNLKVIAEGVETRDQKEFLKRNGCDFMQGYLFNRPITVEAMNQILKMTSTQNPA